MQLTCHDIPQTCIQCYIIIQLTAQGDPVSALQYAVLIVCVIVAGSVGSGIDLDMDTSAHYRRREPRLYGFLPDGGLARFVFSGLHLLHLSAFFSMRVIACALLLYARPAAFGVWIITDFVIFTCAKLWLKTYMFFKPAPNYISHMMNVIVFFHSFFLPVLILRNPFFTMCGRHTINVVYGCCIG